MISFVLSTPFDSSACLHQHSTNRICIISCLISTGCSRNGKGQKLGYSPSFPLVVRLVSMFFRFMSQCMMSLKLVRIIELFFAVFTDNLLRQQSAVITDGFISYVLVRSNS